MDIVDCKSWPQFKERLLRYAALPRDIRDAYIFRGHSDSDWHLQSTLDRRFRTLSVPQRTEKLERLLSQFSRELYGLEASRLLDDSERLELIGRHHGLPTTVLDWSTSPYVAAYFAFESEAEPKSKRIAIWSFDRRSLAKTKNPDQILIDDMTLLGENIRAIQQRGVFLRLPIGQLGEDALAAGLRKFTLPYAERTVALNDLDEMLITAKSLFRDRDGAARTAIIRESLP